nr:cytidylate kinase-like family protein [uncultured Agathobacter sp.]
MSEERYVITVTRQFGSMGRPIAEKLAKKLGINYYDRDIVDMTAKKLNMSVSEISELEESVQGKFFYMKYPLGMATTETQDKIFEQQKEIIRNLAQKGSCVVVGRCSDYILKDFDNCINIYIYADEDKRYEVCLNDFKMQSNEAKKMMLEIDKARERYHKEYAGYLPSDPSYKDLMINSASLGIDGTVNMLEQYIKVYLDEHKK